MPDDWDLVVRFFEMGNKAHLSEALRMHGLRSALLPLLVCAGLFVTSASGDTLYANLSDSFGTLDPTTGVFTPLGTSPSIFGMGFAPDGTLYATDSATPAGVYQVDPLSGNLTSLGSLISDSATGSTVGSDGLIYAVSADPNAIFFTIDPTTLAENVINSGFAFSSDGLAVFANGTFYTDAIGGGNDVLEAVDPVTGVATQIGTGMGVQIFAGANVNGTIYGGAADGNLYSIEPSTGLATFDATITGSSGDVFALASVPEPSTAMLAGAGIALIGLVFTVRRRRPKSGLHQK
jgi:hypothetical protein